MPAKVTSTGGLKRRIDEITATLDGAMVTAGLQGQGGAPGEEDDATLVRIGRAHEYGIGVPERPFMRSAAKQYGPQWRQGAAQAVKEAAQGHPQQALQTTRLLGTVMVGDIQESIATGPWVPNAPETVKRKGSSRPLIDDAQMIQSIRAVLITSDGKQELIG